MSSISDLTATARIRHAALDLFGEQGFEATTMRQIAQRAGVSLGLVNHHFGSKDGLRDACDDWALNYITNEKLLAATGGSLPELTRYLTERPELAPLMNYLTRALRDGGAVADAVFDSLVSITRELSRVGEEAGTIKPTADEDGRAALLVAYSAGAMLFGAQLARHLGGDTLLDDDVYQRYAQLSLELFAHGALVEGAFPLTPKGDA